MLPGELVMRPLELHRQDTNLTDPVAGGLSQLHVLIPKVPCQTHTCCQASPDLRSVQILQPITFCFLFIFSLFPQNSRAAWSGHDCHIGCIEAGRMVGGHGLGLSRTLCGMRTCKIFALSVKTVVYGQSPVQVTPSTLAFNKSGYDVQY